VDPLFSKVWIDSPAKGRPFPAPRGRDSSTGVYGLVTDIRGGSVEESGNSLLLQWVGTVKRVGTRGLRAGLPFALV
jgi:hypothetical protein